MPNSKSEKTSFQQYCCHPVFLKKYGGPVPMTKEACNRCNDLQIQRTGYCCPDIDCARTCTRFGNPDLCNYARETRDAYKNDPETIPLLDVSKKLKERAESPKKWKKAPPPITNGERYGSVTPVIRHAELMHKLLEKKQKDS